MRRKYQRIAYWGSELARYGRCTLCGGNATPDANLAFVLPVAFSDSEISRVDWKSDILAAVCRQCYERCYVQTFRRKAPTKKTPTEEEDAHSKETLTKTRKRKISDVTCPDCGAPPGELCVMHPILGYGWRRWSHSGRYLALHSIDQEFNEKLESDWTENRKGKTNT